MSDDMTAAAPAAEEVIATPAAAEVAGQEVAVTSAEGAETEAEAEKTRSQRRREQREAQNKRLEEEKAQAEARAAAAEARLSRIAAAARAQAEPKEADFPDPFEYSAAKGAWHMSRTAAEQRVAEERAEVNEAKREADALEAERRRIRAEDFAAEMQEARTRYQDYDAAFVVASDSRVVSPALSAVVLESERAADLAYHLGKNPDVARRLSSMPPTVAAMELGRIEARLSAPQPKLASSAPPPISPVRPSAPAVRDASRMSADEYRAARKAGWKP
jgi:hypothetical protein